MRQRVRDGAVVDNHSRGEGGRVSGRAEVRIVEKPWGHEVIWAHTDRYVGKILHINAGHALSCQYHERKDETISLLSGRMIFRVGQGADAEEIPLEPGQSYRITPGTVHQMEAVTDCQVLEASTPDLDDVVRLTDRYGRA
jgi:mannose-6-phosphate isomerase-like protein (cupin superfamily)